MQYDKGIPVPQQKRRIDSFYNRAKKFMTEMEIGDSVFITFENGAKQIQNSLGQEKHRGQCNYVSRKENNGIRFWKLDNNNLTDLT